MMRILVIFLSLLWCVPAHAHDVHVPVTIYSMSGEHLFDMDLAATPATRAKGLQHVTTMPEHSGMLFVFPKAADTAFWMKDTLIPLDMVFIDDNYTIVHIEHSAAPHSLDPRKAGQPYIAVAELLGGTAKRLGIERADRVRFLIPEGVKVQ